MSTIAGGILLAVSVLAVIALAIGAVANWAMDGSNPQQKSIDEKRAQQL